MHRRVDFGLTALTFYIFFHACGSFVAAEPVGFLTHTVHANRVRSSSSRHARSWRGTVRACQLDGFKRSRCMQRMPAREPYGGVHTRPRRNLTSCACGMWHAAGAWLGLMIAHPTGPGIGRGSSERIEGRMLVLAMYAFVTHEL